MDYEAVQATVLAEDTPGPDKCTAYMLGQIRVCVWFTKNLAGWKSKFKVGDVVVRDTYSGSTEKFYIDLFTGDGIPYAHRFNSRGNLSKKFYCLGEHSVGDFQLDPDAVDAILLDTKYDPASAIHKLRDINKEIKKYNLSIREKMPTDLRELRDWVIAKIAPGAHIWIGGTGGSSEFFSRNGYKVKKLKTITNFNNFGYGFSSEAKRNWLLTREPTLILELEPLSSNQHGCAHDLAFYELSGNKHLYLSQPRKSKKSINDES